MLTAILHRAGWQRSGVDLRQVGLLAASAHRDSTCSPSRHVALQNGDTLLCSHSGA